MLLLSSQNNYDSTRIDRRASVRVVALRADSLVSASRLGFAARPYVYTEVPSHAITPLDRAISPTRSTTRRRINPRRSSRSTAPRLSDPPCSARLSLGHFRSSMRRTTAIWLFRGPTEVTGGITCFLLASLALVSSASLSSLRSSPSLTRSPQLEHAVS